MEGLNRFVEAQKDMYPKALAEIKNGMKRSHWMWYIFPQIAGLGSSSTAVYYAINSLEEAKDYLDDQILGGRLKEISKEIIKLTTNSAVLVFGGIDALKLRSSMTLFDYVCAEPNNVFQEVINKYFDGEKDQLTLRIVSDMEKKLLLKK